MSEIKFACPHCSQHIACDDIYCGERIDCPGCKKELFIPRRATFIPLHSGNMTMALPVAFKERQYPRAAGLDLWSEKEWDERAGQAGSINPLRLMPVWIFLLLPFVMALVLAMNKARPASFEIWFILCAIVVGFYFAKIQNRTGLGLILMGIVYSIAALVLYVIIAVGLLFVGCLVILTR